MLSSITTQAQTWCDDGAYLLANQLVDKLQSKEEAQAALREIERFLEGAPSMLNSGTDVLAMEYEAVITPQLQVGTSSSVSHRVNMRMFKKNCTSSSRFKGPVCKNF